MVKKNEYILSAIKFGKIYLMISGVSGVYINCYNSIPKKLKLVMCKFYEPQNPHNIHINIHINIYINIMWVVAYTLKSNIKLIEKYGRLSVAFLHFLTTQLYFKNSIHDSLN